MIKKNLRTNKKKCARFVIIYLPRILVACGLKGWELRPVFRHLGKYEQSMYLPPIWRYYPVSCVLLVLRCKICTSAGLLLSDRCTIQVDSVHFVCLHLSAALSRLGNFKMLVLSWSHKSKVLHGLREIYGLIIFIPPHQLDTVQLKWGNKNN